MTSYDTRSDRSAESSHRRGPGLPRREVLADCEPERRADASGDGGEDQDEGVPGDAVVGRVQPCAGVEGSQKQHQRRHSPTSVDPPAQYQADQQASNAEADSHDKESGRGALNRAASTSRKPPRRHAEPNRQDACPQAAVESHNRTVATCGELPASSLRARKAGQQGSPTAPTIAGP